MECVEGGVGWGIIMDKESIYHDHKTMATGIESMRSNAKGLSLCVCLLVCTYLECKDFISECFGVTMLQLAQ